MISRIISSIISEDFKTVEKKFIDSGVPGDQVKNYLQLFKDAKAKNKIKDLNDINIDNWGKKSFNDFKLFVDKISQEKTKSEREKEVKMHGADLVAENNDWKVYRITEHNACMIYGKGTKWCITQASGEYWSNYSKDSNFYFLISKNLDESNKFYKIAMQVKNNGKITYWDSEDNDHSSLPKNLNIPKFSYEIPEENIEIDGKLISISAFQKMDNLKVGGSLNLRDTQITSLPQGLEVGGSLNLAGTQITSLPQGLEVVGSLNLRDTQITSLPQGLEVGGSLYLIDTQITSLPQGLEVVGNLDLTDTQITSLPQGLKVGGSLYLVGTKITSLPQDLKVGGSLDLTDTQITSLPKDLEVGGGLYLTDTKIKSLPQGLKVGGSLYLTDTQITSLPKDLKVGGDLDLSGTQITSLPQGLKVGGNLDLAGTQITSLPQGLEVGGSLYLIDTQITSLPQDLKVGGRIFGFKTESRIISSIILECVSTVEQKKTRIEQSPMIGTMQQADPLKQQQHRLAMGKKAQQWTTDFNKIMPLMNQEIQKGEIGKNTAKFLQTISQMPKQDWYKHFFLK